MTRNERHSIVKISVTSADLSRLVRQLVKMAGVSYTAVSQAMIMEAVERVFGEQEREEETQRAQDVVDEVIREVTDQLIKQTVEEAKLEVCMEEGLPPEILQMIDDYAV